MECRATSITILVREWWAALVLISTFQDVTKYTIGGIISDLHTPAAEREEAVIKILS